MSSTLSGVTTVDRASWSARQRAHQARVDRWVDGHLTRRRTGRKHPVEDFLFTYYSYRPQQLRRWHPGAGVVLADAEPGEFGPGYRVIGEGVTLDADAFLTRRADAVRFIVRLLKATAGRAPHLGCFGMHEWAMVYRRDASDVRHAEWPLRLDIEATAAVVDSNPVRCSHFDAYRFFTEPARELNLLRPTRANQLELDQPGCLHANMDLYKWAYKCSPLVGSELIAECFELAREIRALDMRAGPYDLSALGYPPVRVETAQGRAEYAGAQREFAGRAAPLRARLVKELDAALSSRC